MFPSMCEPFKAEQAKYARTHLKRNSTRHNFDNIVIQGYSISDFDMEDKLFSLKDIRLRRALPRDFKWLLHEDKLLDWHTTPNVIKMWMQPGFTDCFIVAEYKGDPVGSILGYKFTENDFSIGFYVVTGRLRGKGIGKLLWNRLVDFSKSCNLWLCSPKENLEMYTRKGFAPAQPKIDIKQFSFTKLAENLPRVHQVPDMRIEQISEVNLDKIVDYDSEICGFRRENFWRQWLGIQVRPGLLALKDGKVQGFVFLSDHSAKHHRFQPLFANDANTASSLLLKIVEPLPKDSTFTADFILKAHCTELVKDIFNVNHEEVEGYVLTALTMGSENHCFDMEKVFFMTEVDTTLV